MRERVRRHDADVETRHVGLFRIRGTYPQRVAGSIGVMRTRQPADFECRTVCGHSGPFLAVEPGLAGLQLSAGWAHLIGERRGSRRFLTSVFAGWGGRAVVLRTWGSSPLEPEEQTLAGVEGNFSVATFNFSLGVLRSVSTGRAEDRTVWTWGFGWGF